MTETKSRRVTLDRLPHASAAARLYLRPIGTARTAGSAAGETAWLDGPVECLVRRIETPREVHAAVAPFDRIRDWAATAGWSDAIETWRRRAAPERPAIAGISLDRPRIMGIVNVTPDSFSDGGDYLDPQRAVAHGMALRRAGADILDIGGESTRPGAPPVDPREEQRRVVPVVRALADAGCVVSIDTRHAAVMRAALDAGAAIVNDVTALAGEPDSMGVVADAGVPVVLMHMQGEPRTMQDDPRYDDAVLDVYDALDRRVAAAEAAGIPRGRVVVDPGIGFGKALPHNLEILAHLAVLRGLGCAILVGASRKRFIGALSHGEPPKQRLPGSIAAGLTALDHGADIIRVHDVAETAQAVAVHTAIRAAG